jgi:hypothetical protein
MIRDNGNVIVPSEGNLPFILSWFSKSYSLGIVDFV